MLTLQLKNHIKKIKSRWYKGSKQICMVYPCQEGVGSIKEPSGSFLLRTFRSGDEYRWIELLNANGELGEWTRERFDIEILPYLESAYQFFYEDGDRLVACAGIYKKNIKNERVYEIGWVAVEPTYQGQGLGKYIVHAALAKALTLSLCPIRLFTDDYRLKAIKLYLSLGFEADLTDENTKKSWPKVRLAIC